MWIQSCRLLENDMSSIGAIGTADLSIYYYLQMEGKNILKYPEANILTAIDDVNRGDVIQCSIKQTRGHVPICRKMGQSSKFSSKHELILVNWVKSLLTKEKFMESVSKLTLELKITFNGNTKSG